MHCVFQVNVTGADTMKLLDKLKPFTSYNCTLHAVTVSDGPLSDPITVTTAEQGTGSYTVSNVYAIVVFSS